MAILVGLNLLVLSASIAPRLRAYLAQRAGGDTEPEAPAEPLPPPEPALPRPADPEAVRALLDEVAETADAFRQLMDRRLRTMSDLVDEAAHRHDELSSLMRRTDRLLQLYSERMQVELSRDGLTADRMQEAQRMMAAGRDAGRVAAELGLQRAEVELAAAVAARRGRSAA